MELLQNSAAEVDYTWAQATQPASGGFDLGGLSGALDYVTRRAVDTWSANTLMQTNQQGQRYYEGQPGSYGGYGQSSGSSSTLLLVVGAAAVLFLLSRKG